MANDAHLRLLDKGVDAWDRWRTDNPAITPDLRGAILTNKNLTGADLSYCNLAGADLEGANLHWANLIYTDLTSAILVDADLSCSDLTNADLSGAELGGTQFGNNNLSVVKGLEAVLHRGPSTIGIDTIYESNANIPERFLIGAGVPDNFVLYIRSLVGHAIEFFPCFISYSHHDEAFARRLYAKMRDKNLRVWFAPVDVKGGQKLHEQIDRAIQMHDRLLLVLSEHSLRSEWVMTEIRKARRIELKENMRKLFPVRLVNFEQIRDWECFDADTGKDLAVEVREYFIPDFTQWKNHDRFEAAFDRLLSDLTPDTE